MSEHLGWIYDFGSGATDHGEPDRAALGGKGASLIEMSRAGLPVPPGFVISTECCRLYLESGQWPDGLLDELRDRIAALEETTGRPFGEGERPLLVAVRSGAAISMPGMMDTLLNCGLHPGLAEKLPDPTRFWSVYIQFIRSFAASIAGLELPAGEGDFPTRDTAERLIAECERAMERAFPRTPWDALVECVGGVFRSWKSDRAVAYRRRNGITGLPGTAVVVQSMFPSRVSGILFTRDPNDPGADHMIVEATYGLGEAVVSGDVDPDRFWLERKGGGVIRSHLGAKQSAVLALDDSAPPDIEAPTLDEKQLAELHELGLRLEKHFGTEKHPEMPMDIEWGWTDGNFALLQCRAIRGIDVIEDAETGRLEEIERLRELSDGRRRVWIQHNLGETLPFPTPLSWAVQRRFMSGSGGFGRMYERLGYRPSKDAKENGFLELICGRIYADPQRVTGMFGAGLPMKYDIAAVARNPKLLDRSPTEPDPDKVDGRFIFKLPGLISSLIRASRTLKRERMVAKRRFENEHLPPYLEYVSAERARDLSALSTADLLAELDKRLEAFDDFGAKALLPGFFGGMALGAVEETLVMLMGEEEGSLLARTLTTGLEGDMTVEQDATLRRVTLGEKTMAEFLERFGHRAVGEMELAEPRWREDSSFIERLVDKMRESPHGPDDRHERNVRAREAAQRELPGLLAKWGGSAFESEMMTELRLAQELLPYRETGKHYLMMAYELVRLALLELARRWQLGDDIFYLHLDELPRFESEGDDLKRLIADRKLRWRAFKRLQMPQVIDSGDSLDALGLPPEYEAAEELEGDPIAGGAAQGPARVVGDPRAPRDLGSGYVLVCASTDPGWTPLFENAVALVVERGGALSHGAIVARDFGIPAVVCPGATSRIPDGRNVLIDGNRGRIALLPDEKDEAATESRGAVR